MFGVACCGALPQPERQVGTTRTNGQNDDNKVDKMSASSRCWITRKEGTNLTCCRDDDLPKTFTFLECSFAETNPQMKTPQRLVYKHFAAIEIACDANVNSDLIYRTDS